MEIVYQFRLFIIIFCGINIVTAVAGVEAGLIGLQNWKESKTFETHENSRYYSKITFIDT